MEFKKFEDKLIIENIVSYCIENNISAREINSLTAKIKLGRLDENTFLREGMREKMGELFGTQAGKYRTAVKNVQYNLQNAINSLNALNTNLNPASGDNIFKKHNISLDPNKEAELKNAVKAFKDAMDTYIPNLENAFKDIGGQVTNAPSEYGQEKLNFNFIFKDEITKLKALSGFDTNQINTIENNLKINITKQYASLRSQEEMQNYLMNVKTQLNKALTELSSTDESIRQKAYITLQSLMAGKVSTSTPTSITTTPPIDPKRIERYYSALAFEPTLHSKIIKVFQDTNKQASKDLKELITTAFQNNKQNRLQDIWYDLISRNPSYSTKNTNPMTSNAAENAARVLVGKIENEIS